jgi:hypothetical protein
MILITIDEFNDYLDTTDAFFINRLGGSDFKSYKKFLECKNNIDTIINYLSIWNGYYDTSTNYKQRKLNLINFYNNLFFIYRNNKISYNACYFIEQNNNFVSDLNTKYIDYHFINESKYFFENILIKKYNNKKILIVSPFVDLIKQQTLKLNKLYNNDDINFEFVYLQTIITYLNEDTNQYINIPHNNFFETIEYYKNEISKLDFDVALLGCGTYAHFIGEHIKNIGKKAFYVGGVLQVFFGVYGDLHLKNKRYHWFDLNYCCVNKFDVKHSPKTLESCNSYIYNEYKYNDIIKTFNYDDTLDNYDGAFISHIIANIK